MPKHKRVFKRVVVISDLHCGHATGLTPPDYQSNFPKWAEAEAEAWRAYIDIMKSLLPIDLLIVNGDLIDGKGGRSGGAEQITTDCRTQAEMARDCLTVVNSKEKIIVRGTPYHVGEDTDWEDIIAGWIHAVKIGDHVWVDVNGLRFNLKHKIGNSSVPYGKGTPLAKEKNWERLWAAQDEGQNADIIIRSHVHAYFQCAEYGWWGCTTPALQGWTKYGARQCSGTIDWGLISFDVHRNGTFVPHTHITRLKAQKVEVVKV